MDWLAVTPRAIVRACAKMLPRLDAEESITVAQRVGVGSGTLTKQTLREIVNSWTRTAHASAPAERPRTKQALIGVVGSMGIGFREVPAR